jgi:hypothetical protein
MNYYENGGLAVATLSWSSASTPKQIIPKTQLFSGVAPAAPSNLHTTLVSWNEIDLAWNDNSDNETGFIIDRAKDSGFTVELTTVTVAAGSTSYQSTGLSPSTPYYYRVRATSAAGDSANAGPVTATTLALTSETWLGNTASGRWDIAANWSSGVIPTSTITAVFDGAATYQPTLYQAQSVKGVDFHTAGWTLGGSFTLTVYDGGIDSAGTGSGATNTVSAAVTMASASTWTGGSGNTLILSGALTTAGFTMTKDGAGTLTVAGTQTHTATSAINLTAGTLNLNSDAGIGPVYNLSLTASGTSVLNFGATQHLNSLTLTETALATVTSGTSKTIVTKSLSMPGSPSPTAKLDLANNFLIVDYDAGTPLAAIQGYVKAGMGPKDGIGRVHWDGTSGITSSTANANYLTSAVGVMDNTFDFEGTRSTKTTFGGQAVDTTSILVRYTYWGDLNLDGKVNYDDVSILVYYYCHPPAADKMGWQTGDLNYDGVMNYDDVSLMVYGYYHQGAPLGEASEAAPMETSVPAAAATSQTAPTSTAPASATMNSLILSAGGQAAIPISGETTASAQSSASQPSAISADLAILPPNQDDAEATDEIVLTVNVG